jgi:PhnB protein
MTTLNPYLNFSDSAREAIEFYHSVFGGELTVNTFDDFGVTDYPGEGHKVMHSQLTAPGGLTIMASDVPSSRGVPSVENVNISLSGTDVDELTGYWNGLEAGGTVLQPLTASPWGDQFGMLTDKFGVSWLVNISAPAA